MPKMVPFEVGRSTYILIRPAKGNCRGLNFSEAEIAQYLEVERAYEAMQTMIAKRIGHE
jgi:hypothetical protein